MPQKVKCLIVTTHYRPLTGGAQTVYDELAREADGQIAVLTASTNYIDGSEVKGWRDFDISAPYSIRRLRALRPVRDFTFKPTTVNKVWAKLRAWQLKRQIVRRVLQMIDNTGAEVLCVGALDALGWLGMAVKKKRRVKFVIYVHGEEVSQAAYSLAAEARRRSYLQAADILVAVSSFTAKLIHVKYDVLQKKIKLLTNGVNLRIYNGEYKTGDYGAYDLPAKPYVFSCGRLIERKGFDKLIEAWPIVLNAVPGVHLLIGGEGPLKEILAEKIKVLGLEGHVSMPGWIKEDRLPEAYGQAELFVMPNRTMPNGDTEGFGLVFLEAAAMGTPSVGGRAGGAVDAIVEGETGLLVNGNNPDDIANAVILMLTDTDLRQKMGMQAHAYARTQGWSQKTSDFLNYLQD